MTLKLLSYAAMALSLAGNYFVNKKQVLGMWIWLVGSTTWCGLAMWNHDNPQVIMFFIYSIFNLDGIRRWSR